MNVAHPDRPHPLKYCKLQARARTSATTAQTPHKRNFKYLWLVLVFLAVAEFGRSLGQIELRPEG